MTNNDQSPGNKDKIGVLVFPLTEECKLFVEGSGKNPFLNLNSKKTTTTATILKHILQKLFHAKPNDPINNKTNFFEGASTLTASLIVVNEDRTSILQAYKQGSQDKPTCATLLEKYPHILEKDTNKLKFFFSLSPLTGSQNQNAIPQTEIKDRIIETRKVELPQGVAMPFFMKKEENAVTDNQAGTPTKNIGDNFRAGDPQLSPITPRSAVKQESENVGFMDKSTNFGGNLLLGGDGSNVQFYDPFELSNNSRNSFFGLFDERSMTFYMREEREKKKQITDESSFFVGSHKMDRTMFSQYTLGQGSDSMLEPFSKIPKMN